MRFIIADQTFMQVKDIMTTKVVSVSPGTYISEVAEILHENNFYGLPVVNESGIVVGVVTERDLFTQDFSLHLPTYIKIINKTQFVMSGNKELPYEAGRITRITAKEVMNKNTFFVSPNLDLSKLAAKFAAEGMTVLPVVKEDNTLLGVVSRSDLLKSMAGIELAARSRAIERNVDNEFKFVEEDLAKRFAYVSKFRANIWVATGVVLFVIGFIMGVIYVVNPKIFNH